MVCSILFLTDIKFEIPHSISLPNGNITIATYIGSVRITEELLLHDVLCVPTFTFNLISARKLTQTSNYRFIFSSDSCYMHDLSTWKMIGLGEVRYGLYHLERNKLSSTSLIQDSPESANKTVMSVTKNRDKYDIWHFRLGHLSDPRPHLTNFHQTSSSKNTKKPCWICPLAKLHRLSFNTSYNRSENYFDLVHCDLWGPCTDISYERSKYFLTIVDDHSRCTWVYLLKLKSDTSIALQNFYTMIET